jgi:hypothetical protein
MAEPGRDAHFQHARKPIEAVLRPSLERPRALSWLPGKAVLLVATQEGRVHEVEPAFGSRERFIGRPDCAQLSTHGDLLAMLGRDGVLEAWNRVEGRRLWEYPTRFVAQLGVRWWSAGIAVFGEDLEDRHVHVLGLDGQLRAQAKLPSRAAVGVSPLGRLVVARSTDRGVSVVPMGKPLPAGEPTQHSLRFGPGGRILGILGTGVTAWSADGGSPVHVRLLDTTTACLHGDGARVALGTRSGAVAMASLVDGAAARNNPLRVGAHDAPVTTLSFCAKGRWLASLADSVVIWSYDS